MWKPTSLCLSAFVTGLLLACNERDDEVAPPPPPAAVEVHSGNEQTGQAGATLAEPIRVKVTSSSGAGLGGVSVLFSPASRSGGVAAGTVTTDADGLAATSWQLGTAAGANLDTVRASVSGVPEPAVFVASVATGAPALLAPVSGDAQSGVAEETLANPLVVEARDQHGNPTSHVAIQWAAQGGGHLLATNTITGADGRASNIWTLGSDGPNVATATALELTGSPVSFVASLTPSPDVSVTGVSPAPIVEGQSATLTGTGFSPRAASNTVTIGGVAAVATAATPTSLSVTVPQFDCRPARDVPIQVTVRGASSNTFSHPLGPPSFTTVAVGQQLLLQNPPEFCLQFAPSTAAEGYLVGVQSVSDDVTILTPAQLTAEIPAGTSGVAELRLPSRREPISPMPLWSPAAERWARHYAAEGQLRDLERQRFGAHFVSPLYSPSQLKTKGPSSIPNDVIVGDRVPIRVIDLIGGGVCAYIPITAVVAAIGARGIWLLDVDNPAGGYTNAEVQSLSEKLDGFIYDTDVQHFGEPGDIDQNNRIAVVITKEVNKKVGLGGFVTFADLAPRTLCAASNEGEVFYGIAPLASNKALTLKDFPRLIAHEFTHIIQFSRRLARRAAPMADWTAEGQATLAEEIAGHVAEGRTVGQNYGRAIAFNLDDATSQDWYSHRFVLLASYFGFRNPTSKVPNAPEECSWLDRAPRNPGPCSMANFQFYGPSWLLLRWLADHFGPTFSGGEQGLQRALINSAATGYANISSVVGAPINVLLAQWAAMLYTDDKTAGLDPRLTLRSWNLFEIYSNLAEAYQLVPRSRGFSSFTDAFNVRAGSTAYFRISGATHPATALRIRNTSGSVLPSHMQVFVVRLQ